MTADAALVTAILGAAVALFVTEWLPVDVVALLVLISLVLTGLVDVEHALAGFGNPAVVTIGAMDDNTLSLPDETVSRYHCRIYQEGNAYVLDAKGEGLAVRSFGPDGKANTADDLVRPVVAP